MTKRVKPVTPTAITLLGPARVTREKMHVDDSDFSPIVVFAPRRGEVKFAVCDGDSTVAEEITATLASMRRTHGPALWIAVTLDAFVKNTPEPIEVQPGDLAAAFHDGAPDVIEQMIVVLRRRNEPAEMAAQSYRYLPSEGFEWGKPELFTNYTGDLVNLIDKFL